MDSLIDPVERSACLARAARNGKSAVGHFLWIEHQPEEEGKKQHTHALLSFENPMHFDRILDAFSVSSQWCRKLDERLESCFCYFVHANQPGKIQYSVDLLQGDDCLIARACQAVRQYKYGHELLVDTVPVALDWIRSQPGRYISKEEFAKVSIRQGWFKAANNSIVKEVLYDHNRLVLASNGVNVDSQDEITQFELTAAAFGNIKRFSSVELEGAM